MKQKLMTALTAIGWLLILTGMAAADGPDWIVGLAVMAVGLAVTWAGSRYIEKRPRE